MQNWQATLLSQYANSPKLIALIESMNDAVDPRANIDAFYANVWNIDTAQGDGLDIWGRIIGITRYLQVPSEIPYFGFQTGGTPETSLPFGSGVFYAGAVATATYALSDTAYRSLLLFKAFSNIARMSIPVLNRLVNLLLTSVQGAYFAEGYVQTAYVAESGSIGAALVLDLGGMAMEYLFNTTLNAYQTAIVTSPGVLPHPTGVTVSIVFDPTRTIIPVTSGRLSEL